MQVTFYNNKAKPTKLDKSNFITLIGATSFHFKDNCSAQKPIIYMEKNEQLLNANYCYIDTLNRYYYIDNVVLSKGGIMEFQLSCDVLMSFRNDILNATAFIERSETLGNKYLNDSNLPIRTTRNTYTSTEIGHFDSNLHTFLVVTGGGVD